LLLYIVLYMYFPVKVTIAPVTLSMKVSNLQNIKLHYYFGKVIEIVP